MIYATNSVLLLTRWFIGINNNNNLFAYLFIYYATRAAHENTIQYNIISRDE